MSGVDLSILVCGIHTRLDSFLPRIQAQLFGQWEALPPADQERVEILVLTDNQKMMLGAKRNALVNLAQGRYVQFVDDDDRVADDFIATLLAATGSGADCIVFQAEVRLNGGPAKICHYSMRNREDRNTATAYYRSPNHISCVRRDVSLRSSFPHVPYGEDSGYARVLLPHLTSEHKIDRVLYFYDYNSETTATQAWRHNRPTAADRPPLVDVIILSRADDPATRRMTQQAVDSCWNGSNGLGVNILVVESGTATGYRHATVIEPPAGPFNYNRSANHAASLGSAEWVMVANNDLIFRDGWLHALIAAGNDLVSPRAPGDRRQADVTGNESGTVCGRHLSGWCYMLRRTLWQQIGGLDDDVDFWCSDDVVIEQAVAAGVTPMLVPAAVVEHAVSATLNTRSRQDRDDLTWRNVHIFNRKYGRDKFADHPQYRAWLAANVPAEVPA